MRGGGGGMMDDDDRVTHAQIPTSFGPELRACLRCRLVKTYDQVPSSADASSPSSRIWLPGRISIRPSQGRFLGLGIWGEGGLSGSNPLVAAARV